MGSGMQLQAPHCPSCGAPVEVPSDVTRVRCGYCQALLVLEPERVSSHRDRPSPPSDSEQPAIEEPDATLWTRQAPRFELSVLEQRVVGAPPEAFAGVELGEERFALVSMQLVDREGQPVHQPLDGAFAALKTSLESDGDPGLAANLALDHLCQGAFDKKLACTVLLFEPRHMRVTPYAAGMSGAVWASSEEGRCITLDGHREALERKMLREAREHFANGRSIHLAGNDLVVLPSPAIATSSGGLRAMLDATNEHLGEAPLRVVTLVKNGYWAALRASHSDRKPTGDVRVAAVRAILPPLVTAVPAGAVLQVFRSRRFEVAALTSAGDLVKMVPLHDDRHVVVWLAPADAALPAGALDVAVSAVTAVLDRRDHGDNDNPRQAGRNALEKLALGPDRVRLAVIQLFDAFERVKYFRAGWKQPLGLGDRGVRSDGMQQFDEGGEATVHTGHRLFFPGALDYEGHRSQADQLAEVWLGGKASRLYEALFNHWKTKRSGPLLEALARAALSDVPGAKVSGLALVTGVVS